MTAHIYEKFSPWGEIEDIAINRKAMRGGCRAYVKYAHRYYSEFAREAMNSQMDVFKDQRDPLVIRWAIDGSGNPLDIENEAERANYEVQQMQKGAAKRRRFEQTAPPKNAADGLTTAEKAELDPSRIVPQMSQIHKPVNKRQQKEMEKSAYAQSLRVE